MSELQAAKCMLSEANQSANLGATQTRIDQSTQEEQCHIQYVTSQSFVKKKKIKKEKPTGQ